MTSRREFFGLLAAAPLVAPAVVKEMAAPGSISSGGLFPDYTAAFRAYQAKFRTFRFKDWTPVGDYQVIGHVRLPYERTIGIPNRIYGAQINADGEAI